MQPPSTDPLKQTSINASPDLATASPPKRHIRTICRSNRAEIMAALNQAGSARRESEGSPANRFPLRSQERASLQSPLSAIRENGLACLHDRVGREPALRIVHLRPPGRLGAARERGG